jgi:ribosomal protein S18 acetylase RimI-like enzyme
MSNLNFRIADAQDAPAIAALVNSVFRGDSSHVGWTTEADFLDGQRVDTDLIKGLILSKDGVILVAADSGGAIVGSVYLMQASARIAYLGMLSVRAELQNSGLGRAILTKAEEICRDDWHCLKLEMNVISQRKELIAWYLRRDYRLTGEIREFPMNDKRVGIPKVPHLEFQVLAKDL